MKVVDFSLEFSIFINKLCIFFLEGLDQVGCAIRIRYLIFISFGEFGMQLLFYLKLTAQMRDFVFKVCYYLMEFRLARGCRLLENLFRLQVDLLSQFFDFCCEHVLSLLILH